MKPTRQTILAALLAACCATTFAAGQAGIPSPEAGQDPGRGPHGGAAQMHGSGPEGGPEHGPGFGGRGHGFGHGFGHLAAALHLSEAQQDKLFAIEHEAAPQRRQQRKAVRRAHQAMRAVVMAERFDEARAGAAARELGQAIAAEALFEARVHAQAMAVLTPEQREQLRKRRQQGPQERP
jgi:Spy/CpxP family protein refolding chaperone